MIFNFPVLAQVTYYVVEFYVNSKSGSLYTYIYNSLEHLELL